MSTSRPLDPEKRGRLEPYRMDSTEKELRALGCKVSPGPDGFRSFTVVFPNGRRFNFWPYSGWFAGKTSGRGFENLVKAGTGPEPKKVQVLAGREIGKRTAAREMLSDAIHGMCDDVAGGAAEPQRFVLVRPDGEFEISVRRAQVAPQHILGTTGSGGPT